MNLDRTDRESQRGYPFEAGNAFLREKKCSMVHVYAISLNSLGGTEGFSCGNQTNVRNKKEMHSQLQLLRILHKVIMEKQG